MARGQYVTFRVEGRLFGLDIRRVREINRVLDITTVPLARPHIRGLVNLRGQVVVIFDLGERLGLGPRTLGPRSHNVVLKEEDVALLVDSLGEVVTAEAGELETPPANTPGEALEYMAGVIRLPGEILVVLSVDKLLG